MKEADALNKKGGVRFKKKWVLMFNKKEVSNCLKLKRKNLRMSQLTKI